MQKTHTRRGDWVCIAAALGLLILIAINISSLHNYYSNYQKEQWDDAAAYVARRIQESDLILHHASWTQLPFDFYFQTDHAVRQHGLPVDLFDRGTLEPKMTQADLAHLRELIRGRERVWLIYSHNWYTDPHSLIPTALAQEGRILDRQSFHGLEVHLYGLPSP